MNCRKELELETFLNDVKNHELTIVRDEGLYRHLLLKKPKSTDMYFEIVTFPGTLVYTGDMGTYVFSRIPDMLQFFRGHKDRPMQINPDYWSEKVQAGDKSTLNGNGIKEWNGDAFADWIRERLDSHEASAEIRELAADNLLAHKDDGEVIATAALWDFRDDCDGFDGFDDLEGFDPTVYTFRYLWCCFALVWAIDRYDEETARRATIYGTPASIAAGASA